jgi:hypothetical protein
MAAHPDVDRRRGFWLSHGMAATPHCLQTAAGPLGVWLPEGERLEDAGGIAYWTPDARLGQFIVAPAEGDDPLAADREGGQVTVEADETTRRGGRDVRHLRYRVRRRVPREVVLSAEGRRHEGGEEVEHVGEVLQIEGGEQPVRARYAVRADAPDDVRAQFAQVLERLRIGDEA